jgi:hypothetical protein
MLGFSADLGSSTLGASVFAWRSAVNRLAVA